MRRRRIQVGCDFTYLAAIDTPVVFQVRPRGAADLVLDHERWSVPPPMELRSYTDLYGNPCARAVLPAGRSSFGYHAIADVPDATEDADPGAPASPARRAARRCADLHPAQPVLPARRAGGRGVVPVRRAGPGLPPGPGHLRLRAHATWSSSYGSSTALSTAADVNAAGRGVCRDFTHLAISFCRALNIPARYVFGYLPDMDVPPDPGADGLRRLDGSLARPALVDL